MKKSVIKFMSALLAAINALAPTLGASAAPAKKRPSVKLLSIGHSYSWNSVEMLRTIGMSQGLDLTVGVVYRGNCYLQTHLANFKSNSFYGSEANPGFFLKYSSEYPNGEQLENQYSLGSAVKNEKWDYIMFQECLDYAGVYDEITDYLPELFEGVKKLATNKDVKYMWHEIWALEKPEYMPLPDDVSFFKLYHDDQLLMYKAVKETSYKLVDKMGFDGIVHSGEAFQLARQSGKYDPTVAGGISLNADHVSHANSYGKYLAALVWYVSFTGCKIDKDTVYVPSEITKEQAMELVDFAAAAVETDGKELKTVDEVFSGESTGTSSVAIAPPPKSEFKLLPALAIGAACLAVAGAAVGTVLALKHKRNKKNS